MLTVILPIACYTLIFKSLRSACDVRSAVLYAAVFWATILTLITEMLSLMNGLHRTGMAIA